MTIMTQITTNNPMGHQWLLERLRRELNLSIGLSPTASTRRTAPHRHHGPHAGIEVDGSRSGPKRHARHAGIEVDCSWSGPKRHPSARPATWAPVAPAVPGSRPARAMAKTAEQKRIRIWWPVRGANRQAGVQRLAARRALTRAHQEPGVRSSWAFRPWLGVLTPL